MVRRLGLHPSDARLVKITAHTPHGAVLPRMFPVPLDGLLAAVARERRVGIGRHADHHIEDLPLVPSRWIHGFGAQWVWAATCATWVGDETDLRHVHRRFDTDASERVVGALPASTDVGRYKSWRIPVVATVADRFTWWCLGDPDRLGALLDWRVGVGKRRRSGEGVVDRWEIDDMGPADWDRIWWTEQGLIARPVPARAAGLLGLAAVDSVPHQIRPPYWRPPQTETGDGGFARESREVIAPWTSRPSDCTPG